MEKVERWIFSEVALLVTSTNILAIFLALLFVAWKTGKPCLLAKWLNSGLVEFPVAKFGGRFMHKWVNHTFGKNA